MTIRTENGESPRTNGWSASTTTTKAAENNFEGGPPQQDDSRDEEQEHAVTLSATATTSSPPTVQRQLPSPCSRTAGSAFGNVASSRDETILLSSAGDVVTARCRSTGPWYYQWNKTTTDNNNEMAMLCCGDPDADCCYHNVPDDLSTQLQQQNGGGGVCSGLLGGAPTQVVAATSVHATDHQAHIYNNKNNNAFRKSPSNTTTTVANTSVENSGCLEDLSALVPIRSFDYSQFYEGGNAMEASKKDAEKENQVAAGVFTHGVPTFLSTFTNVKITAVSAHPLGNHVLLISNAGLLYSYGLNDFGQLGIGMKTSTNSIHRGYVLQPTIVTPLVENGGKAIRIAAGTNHSLVVVETEERRLIKSSSQLSFDTSNSTTTTSNKQQQQKPQRANMNRSQSESGTEAFVHHQMYGFGCNDYRKIGLVRQSAVDSDGCVVLPRRVNLRCSVVRPETNGWSSNDDETTCNQQQQQQGIFAVEASAEHSAALVRKASGDVELYTWGNAMNSCLGLPPSPTSTPSKKKTPMEEQAVRVVPIPSFVASLSRTSHPDAQSSSLLLNDQGEYPVDISLGRHCSFVVTSLGRCFSFGMSDEGMLGLGPKVVEADQPTEIAMPREARQESIVSVSAGGGHVVVCTKSGNAYGWGAQCQAGIVSGATDPASDRPVATKPKDQSSKEHGDEIEWSPKRIDISTGSLDNSSNSTISPPFIVQACAGFDCSFFVTESGSVHSTGKNSGRLGLGEISEDVVTSPKPLFGGLQLWKKSKSEGDTPLSVQKPTKAVLRRGVTTC